MFLIEAMTLELLWAGVIGLGIIAYAILGGADFGAGVWLVNTRFKTPESERRELYKAIGPVWEANHVWILFVMIACWNAFPAAFADACRILWLPLMLALAGIVARGSAYAFRTHLSTEDVGAVWFWERVFGGASVLAPFAFGWGIGTLSTGFDRALPREGEWQWSWLAAFCSFYAVGLCAYLSALYLYRESTWLKATDRLEVWRGRCLTMAIILGIFAAAGLVIVALETPVLAQRLLSHSGPIVLISMISGLASAWSVATRRPTWSMAWGILAVATVLLAWMAAMAPYLIPGVRTLQADAAPPVVLRAMLVAALGGSVLLIPSLILLFVAFKRGPGDTLPK